jgi:hypothetical protein
MQQNQSMSPSPTAETPVPQFIYNEPLPQTSDVKYLGLHLDNHLTWIKHFFTMLKHLGILLTKLHWLVGRKSKLNLRNKLLIYRVIIKPVWTYGIQLWGSASNSNIAKLERFQSKALRLITDAPWYDMFPMLLFAVTFNKRGDQSPKCTIQRPTHLAHQSSSNSTFDATSTPQTEETSPL